jgi:hypothetical protein
MSTEVWGQMAKSQVDETTIEERVAEMIAEHEADPDAHTGENESLAAHRENEVIDHMQGSVAGDKISNLEAMNFFPLESFDNYAVSTGGIWKSPGGVHFETGSTINTVKYLSAGGQYAAQYFNVNKAVTFQFVGRIIQTSNVLAYGMVGGDGLRTDPPGVGFKFHNGSLYMVETVFGEESFDEYTSAISGVDYTTKHVYRVQVVPADNKAYFWVDGVLKGNLTLHTNADVGLMQFAFYLKNLAASSVTGEFGGVYLSIAPN